MKAHKAWLDDADAFSQLFTRTHLMVYRFIYGMHGGPQEEVEDLTAETYMRAWKARHRFDGDQAAALGWLFQIARNLVIDTHRRRKTRGEFEDLEAFPLPDPQSGPEEKVALQEEFEMLWVALQSLPLEQREMIVLRYIAGWPVNRIATHLGLLENTVSVTMKRVLLRLRSRWQV